MRVLKALKQRKNQEKERGTQNRGASRPLHAKKNLKPINWEQNPKNENEIDILIKHDDPAMKRTIVKQGMRVGTEGVITANRHHQKKMWPRNSKRTPLRRRPVCIPVLGEEKKRETGQGDLREKEGS